MSKCISMHGEYSDCAPDQNFICKRCIALDEDALFAKVERLEASIAFKDDAMLTAMRNLITNDAAMKSATKQIAERDATIERIKALADKWTNDFMMRDTTHDDRDDRADARDDCAIDIRATLDTESVI